MINSVSSNDIQIITNNNKNNKSINTINDQIKILQQQETAVRKQIDNIKGNDTMDIKIKQELIKPLEAQIQSIESQIQQVQIENINKKNDISASSDKGQMVSTSSSKELENKIQVSKDSLLLSMSNTYKQTKNLNSIGRGLNNQANILNSEAESDEMRGNYNSAKMKRAEASSNMGKANAIQSKIGKLHNEINKAEENTSDLNEELKYIPIDEKDDINYKSGEEREILNDDSMENKSKTIDKFV